MLRRLSPLLVSAVLVVSCTSGSPPAATVSPAALPTPATTPSPLAASSSPTAELQQPTPAASPTRMRLRDRAEASRKAKAIAKEAEKKALKAKYQGSTSVEDLLLWLPLDGNLRDKGPMSVKAAGVGIELAPARDGSTNGAYEFLGDGSIAISNVAKFNNLEEFTLSAWAAPSQRSEHSNIISKVTPGRDFNMQLNIDGKLMTHFENRGYEFATSLAALPLNRWTFVTATFGDGEWRLYLNGELDSVHPVTKVPPWTGGLLTVGNLYPGAGEGFQGSLDDVRVYRRALTATEIQAIMDGLP